MAVLVAALLPLVPAPAGAGVQLGEPPAAPSPEETARLRQSLGPAVRSGAGTAYVVDTADREEVRNFFNTVYSGSEGFSVLWTGRHDGCVAGTTDAASRDLTALRVNYFRAMAGVPAAITFNDAWNAKSQQSALMMSANDNLSHYPPTSWTCFTADGYEGAGKSNIALGNAGPDAVTAYMEDFGGGNAAVGHRRWILYPQTQVMGTGDVPAVSPYAAANALWVFDGNFGGTRPATRTAFVAWPPPGHVPYPVVFARWSFSYPGATFTGATVSLTSNGQSIPVTLEPVQNNIGENSLVWYPSHLNPSAPYSWPRPAADTAYSVTVRDVTIGGSKRSFSYDVIAIDPAVPTPGRIEPLLAGPAQPAVGQPNLYSFSAVPDATAHQGRISRRTAFSAIEGAENNLQFFTAQTSAGYNPVSSSIKATGARSFHLAHPVFSTTQTLTSTRVLLPSANAEVRFASRLGWATPNQIARFQISENEGQSWITVHSQAGTGDAGDTAFTTRTASLAAFAGRSLRYRLAYEHTGSTFFPQTDDGIGWYVDDITFTHTEELTSPQTVMIPSGNSFNFVPAQTGDFAIDARAQVYGEFFLDWGPALRVSATNAPPPPVIHLDSAPALAANRFQFDFTVTGYRAGLVFDLWKSSGPGGPWAVDPAATFQTLTPSSRFRVSSPIDGPRQFYRVSIR